jgi:hypothetical protein
MKSTTLLIVASLFVVSCNQSKKDDQVAVVPLASYFINPPLKGVDVPFKDYTVDAAKGDTVFYQTGSIIVFPPNSFVDKDGKIIEGNVDVKYREFSNPIDFYLSGIPMDYDSAGKKYTFESAGMCEMNAYQNGIPVFVNPVSKPSIDLTSNTTSPLYDLYYLDTVKRQWINRGASVVTDMNHIQAKNAVVNQIDTTRLIEPVKPYRANDLNPVINVVIDPASFKELLAYDKLKFQVDPSEKNFNPNDTSEEWNNLVLERTTIKGLYKIKFSNARKAVEYKVRPVMQGEDYDKAMKIFEKNNEEYTRNLAERIKEEKIANEENNRENIKASIENKQYVAEAKRIEDLNVLIRARNKEIAKEKEDVEKQNLPYNIMRSFEIDGFGIWNCDRVSNTVFFNVLPFYKNTKGDTLDLSNVAVIYTLVNGIYMFSGSNIEITGDGKDFIFGITGNKFAYITSEDFAKVKVDIKTPTFTMTVVPDSLNNYKYIKSLVR